MWGGGGVEDLPCWGGRGWGVGCGGLALLGVGEGGVMGGGGGGGLTPLGVGEGRVCAGGGGGSFSVGGGNGVGVGTWGVLPCGERWCGCWVTQTMT